MCCDCIINKRSIIIITREAITISAIWDTHCSNLNCNHRYTCGNAFMCSHSKGKCRSMQSIFKCRTEFLFRCICDAKTVINCSPKTSDFQIKWQRSKVANYLVKFYSFVHFLAPEKSIRACNVGWPQYIYQLHFIRILFANVIYQVTASMSFVWNAVGNIVRCMRNKMRRTNTKCTFAHLHTTHISQHQNKNFAKRPNK